MKLSALKDQCCVPILIYVASLRELLFLIMYSIVLIVLRDATDVMSLFLFVYYKTTWILCVKRFWLNAQIYVLPKYFVKIYRSTLHIFAQTLQQTAPLPNTDVQPMRNGVSEHVHDAMADHMILMANCVREQQVQISTLQDQLSATQEAVSHIPAEGFISQLDRELTHYVNKFKRTPAWNSPQLASFREWITPLRFVIFMTLIFLLKSTFLFIIFKVVKWMVLGFAVRAAYLKRRNIRKKMGWIIGFIVLFIIW